MADAADPSDEAAAPAGGTSDTAPPAADSADGHPFLFLAGLVLFLVSVVTYLADLATGHGVRRSLALNGAATVVLVGWAARDTLVDPDAEVSSVSGAVGTALLLLAVYLLVTAVAVALTSPWHDSLGLTPWLGGAAVVVGVVGFVVFPVGAVLGDE